ncbi:hypothetical protein QBC42DRAFT_280497 [Cladorrhinum samala]|uniref:F-box domain-containing protein n=1 Tax=Cladorrhinum samala TaxID=585594 RepID=A0AAV9HA88_9PEZI|nr:hypothetical protein QBC42DRAFT_280497 [Cladorrhinum samala]
MLPNREYRQGGVPRPAIPAAHRNGKRTSLESIPNELLHLICSFMPGSSLKQFRATSRLIGAIADYYALKQFRFWLHADSFDVLRSIAKHPHRSQCIKSLVYMTATLRRHRPRRLTNGQDDADVPEEIIISPDSDFELLSEVIPKLTSLEEMVVSNYGDRRDTAPIPSAFSAIASPGFRDGSCTKIRHMRAMIDGIAAAGSSVRLKSIRTGWLSHRDFDPSDPDIETRGTLFHLNPDTLAHLTTFDVMIRTGAWSKVERRNAGLRQILSRMPCLETLSLEFERPSHYFTPTMLEDFIPAGQHWPKLKSLHIGRVHTDREPLHDFLLRHKNSLETLSLLDPSFTKTSWGTFLPQVKESFRSRQLEVLLFGFVQGRSEEIDAYGQQPVEWFLSSSIEQYYQDHAESKTNKVRDFVLSDSVDTWQ